MDLGSELKRRLVHAAARAPSVHNVQPARWRIESTGEVFLLRDRARVLPVADPHRHDVRLSLGAAWEGMALACSQYDLALSPPRLASLGTAGREPEAGGLEPVAGGVISAGGARDRLAEQVWKRRCFRGRFLPVDEATRARVRRHFEGATDVHLVEGDSLLAQLARGHDRASFGFLSRRSYLAEFLAWCRFSRRDPQWGRDGLNGECLGLSALERAAASVLLRPAVFALLARLNLARPLVTERREVESASIAVVLLAPRDADPFVVGRRFYRLWLELAALGLGACPMSALADDRDAAAWLGGELRVPQTQRIVNVWRSGLVPPGGAPESPRLPVAELLV